jgi:uncharacterized membrane protein
MFTWYNTLLFVHIVCAIIWVGGAVFAQLLVIRAERSDDPIDLVRTGKSIEFIAQRVFIPSSILLFIAGAWMVVDGPWEFEQAWVAIAIVLWLASALVGSLYLGPTTKKVAEIFEREGPTSAAGVALMKRAFLVSRLELASFAVIVFLMVFKPGV